MLLVSETIKNTIIEAFKKLSKTWKQRKHCEKCKGLSDNLQELVELAVRSMDDGKANGNKSVSADDKSKKNLPNNSALFKVHLPVDGQQGESIVVKMLEFSPEVLVSIYVKTVDCVLVMD